MDIGLDGLSIQQKPPASGGGGGDPLWDNVTLLINGIGGVIEDERGHTLNITNVVAAEDGMTWNGGFQQRIVIPFAETADICMHKTAGVLTAWTMEFYLYWDDPTDHNTYFLLLQQGFQTQVYLEDRNSIGPESNAGVSCKYSSFTQNVVDTTGIAAYRQTEKHIAIELFNNTLSLYVDGVLSNATVVADWGVDAGNDYMLIPNSANPGVAGRMKGVRFTRGVARYKGNFTPPALPLPTQGGLSNDPFGEFVKAQFDFSDSTTDLLGNVFELYGSPNGGSIANGVLTYPSDVAANNALRSPQASKFNLSSSVPFVIEGFGQLLNANRYQHLFGVKTTTLQQGLTLFFIDSGWGADANTLTLKIPGTTGGQLSGNPDHHTARGLWTINEADDGMFHYAVAYDGVGEYSVYANGNRVINVLQQGTVPSGDTMFGIGGAPYDSGITLYSWVGDISSFRYTVGTDRGYNGATITVPPVNF